MSFYILVKKTEIDLDNHTVLRYWIKSKNWKMLVISNLGNLSGMVELLDAKGELLDAKGLIMIETSILVSRLVKWVSIIGIKEWITMHT